MEKKTRFGDLVRNSGRPQVYTVWTEPKKDRALTRAIKENRVLTVIPEPGAKDYGMLGFQEHPRALYLVFPRSLPQIRGSRMIGINYQLTEEPEVADPVRVENLRPKARPTKPKPTKRTFTVRVRRTATVDDEVAVQAMDQEQAEGEAKEKVRREPFDLARSEVREEVVKPGR